VLLVKRLIDDLLLLLIGYVGLHLPRSFLLLYLFMVLVFMPLLLFLAGTQVASFLRLWSTRLLLSYGLGADLFACGAVSCQRALVVLV
jgi:hypothetical protein